MLGDFRTKPKAKSQWILWWRVDEDDLQDQVTKYDTLGWFQSARKLSVICLLFSIAVTLIVTLFGALGAEAYVDSALMAVLATFIYRGHRWAAIAAMVLWTLEKGVMAITGLNPNHPPSGVSLVVSLLWWAIYMHAFYLAFRVEQERRRLAAAGLTAGHDMSVWD